MKKYNPASALPLAAALTACTANTATVEYEGGKVRLTAVSENIIRVEAVPEGAEFSTEESLSVVKRKSACRPDIRKENGDLVFSTAGISARVDAATGRVRFFDREGNLIAGEDRREFSPIEVDGVQVMPDLWRTAWNPNGRKFECSLDAGKKVNLKIEWEPDGGTSYCALKVLPPVDEAEQGKMSWWGEMQDGIDYYYIAADDVDGVISGYRELSGKAPILPKWALGYWQSRERYTSQEQILGVMTEFRRRGIPVDNIVQDWQYWKPDQWGSHEFDGNGWIYRTAIDEKVIDWLGYSQSFYDAYNPDARKLFWKQMYEHLYPIGVDSWWMDASEPNIHDCTDMDYRKKMAGPTAMGPSTKYLNAYALLNAEAIYDGHTYDYEKGEYARIGIAWDDDARLLKLSRAEGCSGIVPDYGTFQIRLFSGKGILTSSVAYTGKETEIKL